jgi:hypothetical protein
MVTQRRPLQERKRVSNRSARLASILPADYDMLGARRVRSLRHDQRRTAHFEYRLARIERPIGSSRPMSLPDHHKIGATRLSHEQLYRKVER